MDVHDKLDELISTVENARAMPMSASCIVNRGEVLGLLEEVRGLLPEEFRHAQMLLAEEWLHDYPRQQAAYPVASLRDGKYWPPVARVDNAYGDRNLVCACLPVEAYA